MKCVGKNSALTADYCNFGITSLTLTAKPAPNPGTSDAVTAAVILGIAAAARYRTYIRKTQKLR